MGIHESSVNYQNLIRDLADMYPFAVAEVVIVELVANSLDAGATRILIDYDPNNNVLVVADNGKGMDAAQFDEYHDFAAGLKTRGTGIGFAGVGAKISFNIADRVITETRSTNFVGGSNWYLQSKRKLLWDDIQPLQVSGNGTRVEVRLSRDSKPPYTSTADLIKILRRNYLPLFDKQFLALYERRGCYSGDFRFVVNGQEVTPSNVEEDYGLDETKVFFPERAGKLIGYGVLGLAASEYPIAPDVCGILLCTYGKVIKADLFNQFPGEFGPRIFGVVEIPDFVNFLTTAKTDFIRERGRYRQFEKLYDPVRQEFKAWLEKLGVSAADTVDTGEAAKLERELKKLVEEVPELGDFFGFRTRKTVFQQNDNGSTPVSIQEGIEPTFPDGTGESQGGLGGYPDVGDQPGQSPVEDKAHGTQRGTPISRSGRRGPKITYDDRPNRIDLAWVDGNSVTINSGHPSYAKARSDSTARRLHGIFAIGSAVQKFLISEGEAQASTFLDRMMAAWGRT